MRYSKWLVVVGLCYVLLLSSSIVQFGKVTDNTPTNAAIVLGAAVFEDQPSPVFEGRLRHAVSLYKQGIVGALIFTGGRSTEDSLAEAEVGMRYALAQGVPREVIYYETTSKITAENLHYAKELTHFLTYTIVSDPLHMKRAMHLAAQQGIVAYSSPTPYSAYQSWYTKLPFLLRETVLSLFPVAQRIKG